jgi:hypothetical protein
MIIKIDLSIFANVDSMEPEDVNKVLKLLDNTLEALEGFTPWVDSFEVEGFNPVSEG